MKVRISGNSIRFRVSRSDLASLQADNRVETTIRFAAEPGACFTYALERNSSGPKMAVRYLPGDVTVMVPVAHANAWSSTEQVGIYDTLDIGGTERLEIIIEKDFACLDGTDAQNADTFPNPAADAVC